MHLLPQFQVAYYSAYNEQRFKKESILWHYEAMHLNDCQAHTEKEEPKPVSSHKNCKWMLRRSKVLQKQRKNLKRFIYQL